MFIKWLTGLIKGKKRRERAKVEIEELKKALLEDPKFRDEVLRELEYRTGRRDLLKAGVLGLLGFTVGSMVGGEAGAVTQPVNGSVAREVVSDYAVKIPKPCTCIVAQDGTGDYDVSPGEDASEVIQKVIDNNTGRIVLKGQFKCENSLKIRKDFITLEGEGNPNNWVKCTTLDFSNIQPNDVCIDISKDDRVRSFSLKNILIKGNHNEKSGIGLRLYNVSNALIENVHIIYCRRAIYIYANWNCFYNNVSVYYCGDFNTYTSSIMVDAGNSTKTETNHQIFIGLQGGENEYVFFETNNNCIRNHLVAPSIEVPPDKTTKGFVFNRGSSFKITNIDMLARGDVGIQIEYGSYIKILGGKIDCNGGNYGIVNKSAYNTEVHGVDIYNPSKAAIYNYHGRMTVFGGYIYGTGNSERGIYNYMGEMNIFGTIITYFNKEAILSFKGLINVYGGRCEKASRKMFGGAVIKLDSVVDSTIRDTIIYVDERDNPSYAFEVRNSKNVLLNNIYAYGNILKFITEPISNINLEIKVNTSKYKFYNSGIAILKSKKTHIDVVHGLDIIPKLEDIVVTPLTNLNGRNFWVSNVTSKTFRINISSPDVKDNTFSWRINC